MKTWRSTTAHVWLIAASRACGIAHLALAQQVHEAPVLVVPLSYRRVGTHGVLQDAAVLTGLLAQLLCQLRRRLGSPLVLESVAHLCVLALLFIHNTNCLRMNTADYAVGFLSWIRQDSFPFFPGRIPTSPRQVGFSPAKLSSFPTTAITAISLRLTQIQHGWIQLFFLWLQHAFSSFFPRFLLASPCLVSFLLLQLLRSKPAKHRPIKYGQYWTKLPLGNYNQGSR